MLLALCNPHLPEPGKVLEPRYLDHVWSAASVHSMDSKAGESSLSPERLEFIGMERESEPV